MKSLPKGPDTCSKLPHFPSGWHTFIRNSFSHMQLHLLDGLEHFWHELYMIPEQGGKGDLKYHHKVWDAETLGLLPCLSSLLSPSPYHCTQKPSVPPSFGHWWRSHHWPGPTGSTPAAASAAHSSYLCYVHWCWRLLRRNNPLGKRPETEELLGILIHLWFHALLSKSPILIIFPQTHLYLPDWVFEDSQSLKTRLACYACISHLQFHTPCRKWVLFCFFYYLF